MNALTVLAQTALACTGLPLLFILAFQARRDGAAAWQRFAAYLALSLLVLGDTALLAAWQIEELRLLMVKEPGAAVALLDAVIAAKAVWRIILALAGLALCRGALGFRLAPAWWAIPGTWALLALALVFAGWDLPALPRLFLGSELLPVLAWGAYGLLVLRRDAGQSPLALPGLVLLGLTGLGLCLLAGAEALQLPALPPSLGAWLRLLGFVGLNVLLYRHHYAHSRSTAAPRTVPDPAGLERAGLSERELAVAKRLAGLASYKEIAAALCISPETVKSHAKAVYRKTACADRLALMRRFGAPGQDSPPNHPVAGLNHPGG